MDGHRKKLLLMNENSTEKAPNKEPKAHQIKISRGCPARFWFKIALTCVFLVICLLRASSISHTFSRTFHRVIGDHRGRCPHRRPIPPPPFSLQEAERKFLKVPSNDSVWSWSKYYTSEPHLPGSDQGKIQAEWTAKKWKEMGIADAEIIEYYPLLTFPRYRRLALFQEDHDEVAFEAQLSEDIIEQDPASHKPETILTHHGYSASGNVTAEIVYVNYGYLSDFEALEKAGISVKGKIVLVKYGTVFRGLKVRAAEKFGAAGVLMYSDPQDDSIRKEDGYKVYPYGPARQPSSVQRGSVGYLSLYAGDPLTPGYPATKDAKRMKPYNIPTIPSLPISYQDALPLLKALEGKGLKASEMGHGWQGALDVVYHVGPSTQKVNLVNDIEHKISPIWNVIGSIPGRISHEVIVIGNHRDAWNHGAGDPNSGSAALMEVIRGFSKLLQEGWQPLRTIVIGSWDAEEIGLVGSTEWGEERKDWLRKHAIAYLNVDIGAIGDKFDAQASPTLSDFICSVAKDVDDPKTGTPIYDRWINRLKERDPTVENPVGYLGSGSDFTVFLQHVGIASTNIGFRSGKHSPIYHYHSTYDSFYWMNKFGDPGYHYHEAISKFWGLMALRLSSEPVLPFNASRYASDLSKFVSNLENYAEGLQTGLETEKITFYHLRRAIEHYTYAAKKLDNIADELRNEINEKGILNSVRGHFFHKLGRVNRRYRKMERGFIVKHGLQDERPWYKHAVFAPGLWKGYEFSAFPAISEALDQHDWKGAQKMVGHIAWLINHAALRLII